MFTIDVLAQNPMNLQEHLDPLLEKLSPKLMHTLVLGAIIYGFSLEIGRSTVKGEVKHFKERFKTLTQ